MLQLKLEWLTGQTHHASHVIWPQSLQPHSFLKALPVAAFLLQEQAGGLFVRQA